MWIVEDDGVERKSFECFYCKTILKAKTDRNGTSNMNKHWKNCKLNPDNEEKNDKKQAKLNFKKEPNVEISVQTWKQDDARIKRALLCLFTIGELSFKYVEHEAFIEYTNVLNSRVILPSRHKISRDGGTFT
ncbi:unnamed protein product [Lactuca saligna]|uniref:BED-type domain-containing protein n=1 Tax=Lactuca saligna TaxID=75948 RepID=A0AA35ZB30_LACSI|nr:unnamed protein product [Lactuca saligna]